MVVVFFQLGERRFHVNCKFAVNFGFTNYCLAFIERSPGCPEKWRLKSGVPELARLLTEQEAALNKLYLSTH